MPWTRPPPRPWRAPSTAAEANRRRAAYSVQTQMSSLISVTLHGRGEGSARVHSPPLAVLLRHCSMHVPPREAQVPAQSRVRSRSVKNSQTLGPVSQRMYPGADPYCESQVGGIEVSRGGLVSRGIEVSGGGLVSGRAALSMGGDPESGRGLVSPGGAVSAAPPESGRGPVSGRGGMSASCRAESPAAPSVPESVTGPGGRTAAVSTEHARAVEIIAMRQRGRSLSCTTPLCPNSGRSGGRVPWPGAVPSRRSCGRNPA